jgi:hypothetical protein
LVPGRPFAAGRRHLEAAGEARQGQSGRHCRIEEQQEGRLVNAESRRQFTWDDPCVERGVTIAYDARAAADAVKSVTDLVNTVLKPK